MAHKCKVFKYKGRWAVTCNSCGPNGDRWFTQKDAFRVAFRHSSSYLFY